ncbi:MAG: hypothetical protein Q7K42_03615, partial [Candidatus Diapherotrites archaeon]|nr:hypothetical protein [Candidatus Diapherotrites archaeon]
MPIKVLRERRVARRQKTQDKKRIKVVEEKKIPVLVPGDYKNNKPEGTVYSIMQLETGDEETLKELIGKKLILPVKGTSFGRKLVEEKDSLGRRIHSDKKIEGLFFVPVRDPGNPQQDYLGRSVSKRFGPLSEVVIKGAGSPAISQAYEEPGNLSLFFIKKGERYNERKFWGGARLPTLRWTNIQADAIAKELEKSKKENDPILKIAEQHGAGQLPTLFPIALMKPLQIPLSNRPESGWKFIYRKRPGDPEPKGKIVKEAVTPEGDIIYTV